MRSIRILTLAAAIAAIATSAAAQTSAQTPVVTVRLAFDTPPTPNNTLAEAQALTYRLYDGATLVPGVTWTCTGTAPPFVCSSTDIPLAAGTHVLAVTAADALGESGKSNSVVIGPPGLPRNLKVLAKTVVVAHNGVVTAISIGEELPQPEQPEQPEK